MNNFEIQRNRISVEKVGEFDLVLYYAYQNNFKDEGWEARAAVDRFRRCMILFKLDKGIALVISNHFYIIASPTDNCQVFSIAQANSLIIACNNYPGLLRAVLKLISMNCAGKPLVLIDINQQYVTQLAKQISKNSFKISENYISSNKSSMAILLIDIPFS